MFSGRELVQGEEEWRRWGNDTSYLCTT